MAKKKHFPSAKESRRSAALQYRGGRMLYNGDGYILEHNPFHPHSNKRTSMCLQHRLVMERHLGRLLSREEVVHHINENRSDNRIQNLSLFPNQGDHRRHHISMDRLRLIESMGEELVSKIREVAADPKGKQTDLPVPQRHIRVVLEHFGETWVSARKLHLTREEVARAVRGATVAEAANSLGVSVQYLHNRFYDLLPLRKSPNWLEGQKDRALRLIADSGMGAAYRDLGTNENTLSQYLQRWWQESDVSQTPLPKWRWQIAMAKILLGEPPEVPRSRKFS